MDPASWAELPLLLLREEVGAPRPALRKSPLEAEGRQTEAVRLAERAAAALEGRAAAVRAAERVAAVPVGGKAAAVPVGGRAAAVPAAGVAVVGSCFFRDC